LALTSDEKQKLKNLTDQEIKDKRTLNALTEEELAYLREIGKIKRESVEYLEDELKAATKLLEVYKEQAKGVKQKTILAGQAVEVEQRLQNFAAEALKTGRITMQQYTEMVDQSKARMHISEELLANQDKFVVSQKEGIEAARQLGKELGGVMSAFDGVDIAGKISQIGKALQGGKAGMIAFASSVGTGIIGNIVNDLVNMVVGAYNMENAFMKATGASLGMAQGVTQTYQALVEFGVSMEEASASAQALFTTFTDFTFMSAEQQQVLQQNTAVLANYGVAVDDLAAGIQIQSKMFGMSGQALNNANNEIFRYAQQIGRAPAELQAEFAAAGASLAKFGTDGMNTFKDLSRVAKVTGMQLEKVLDMTNVADTFEGAATAAAKLNAAVGSNMVNAMDLMMATDPVERFEMMKGALTDAGLAFNDMSYYQKIFYADALGLNDVSELALVMSGRTDLLAGSTEQAAEDYEKLAEESLAVQSIQEAFTAALAKNSDEIIEMLGGMDEWIKTLRALPQHFDTIIEKVRFWGTILGIGMIAMGLFGIGLSVMAAKAVGVVAGMGPMVAGMTALVTEMGLVAGSSAAAGTSVGGLGVANAGAATAAGGHATAVGALLSGLAGLEVALIGITAVSGPYIAAMQAMAATATTTSAVMAGSGKVIWMIVPAILALGAAIGGVILAMGYLVQSFSGLGDAAWPAVAGIAAVSLGVMGMMWAITLLTSGPQFWAFMGALGLMAVIAGGIAIGLSSIGDAIDALAQSLTGLTDIDANVKGLRTLRSAMVDLAADTAAPENSIMSQIQGLASVNLDNITRQAQQLSNAINSTQEDEARAFANAMTALRTAVVTVNAAPAAPNANQGDSGTQQVTITDAEFTIKLDGPATTELMKGIAVDEYASYVKP